jgi:PAS domain S-box-containing protein
MIRRSIEQRQSAERLKESEEIYEKLFKDNVEAMILVEPRTGAIADVNTAATTFFGYSREEMLRMNIADTSPGMDKQGLALFGHRDVEKGAKMVMPSFLSNGEMREVEVDSGMLRVKGRALGYAIIHDITKARKAQRREQRLNRALKVLSATSQLILDSSGETDLLDGICRALVEYGGYVGAWVGGLEPASDEVREVAIASRHASNEPDILTLNKEVLVELALQVKGSSEMIMRQNGNRGESTYHEKAGKANAYVALPLKIGGDLKAVMVIASDDLEPMEVNETLLLQELAESLSKAISLIDERDTEKTVLSRKAAMADEQGMLRQIVDASTAAMLTFDQNGRTIFATSVFGEMLGMGKESMLGKAYNSPEWRVSSMDGRLPMDAELPFAVVMKTGEPLMDVRYSIEPLTGKKRYLSLDAIPLKGHDSKVHGVAITAKDITATVLQENQSQSDALLQELMGSALDTVVKIDQEGNLVYVSPAVKNLLWKEPEELIGRSVLDYVHPDDQESLLQTIQDSSRRQDQLTVRFRLRRRDDYIVVEAIGRVLMDEMGEPTSIIGSVRDITPRQLAEDRLWETGSKLRAIIQTSPMAIVSLDSNGVINTWNPAAERVFGWGNIDSGRPFPFFPDDDSEELRQVKSKILAGEALSDIELNHKDEGERERRISISTAPILDQSGKVISIILVASDITERKAMEDRLIQLNDLLRLVNRILRHDTLNELMVVAGSLDMFQKSKQERFLVTATKAVNRSVEMIRRMKELESLAASGGAMKVYDLRQTAEKVLRGYMVDFSVEGEGSIYADDALPSAIDNIVRNAMVHGKADRIDARIWVKDGRCYLRIADNGAGIPDQVKGHLFDEGFSYGANAGTGLGLYLVTRAVARYGGSVSVEDNQPKGAAFLMVFPEVKAEAFGTMR